MSEPTPITTASPARGQSQPSVAPVEATTPAARNRAAVTRGRSDDDVLAGAFASVVSGPYEGRYGVYVSTASVGADGYPVDVLFKTRDDRDEYLTVAYADLRPDHSGKR